MSTQSPSPAAPAQAPRAAATPSQLGVGIGGAVLGTLLTSVVTTSPGMKLGVALLGAVIPVLVTTAGKHHRVRIVVGVGLTALVVTYCGFTAVDYATDGDATFPLPSAAQDPAAPGGFLRPGGGGPIGNGGDGAVAVDPGALECSSAGSCGEVAVSNTGDADVQINEIRIDGDGAGSFGADGCEGETLAAGDACAVQVAYTPPGDGGVPEAQLVVAHDAGDAATVDLRGVPQAPAISLGQPQCTYEAEAQALVVSVDVGTDASALQDLKVDVRADFGDGEFTGADGQRVFGAIPVAVPVSGTVTVTVSSASGGGETSFPVEVADDGAGGLAPTTCG